MYAIIEDGSRQYRIEPNATVVLDYRDVQPGQQLELTKVLLYQNGADTLIGRPLVEGARVVAEVVDLPTKKTVIQKFRRRKNYRRLKGHTQPYVRVRVKHILRAGEQPPAEQPKPAEQPAAPAPAAG
jgi:large subunit ribosomal protein L21